MKTEKLIPLISLLFILGHNQSLNEPSLGFNPSLSTGPDIVDIEEIFLPRPPVVFAPLPTSTEDINSQILIPSEESVEGFLLFNEENYLISSAEEWIFSPTESEYDFESQLNNKGELSEFISENQILIDPFILNPPILEPEPPLDGDVILVDPVVIDANGDIVKNNS